MKDIMDLKIVGIDDARPPKMRKEPYIDLVFKLSDKVCKEWCQDFNMLFANTEYSVRADMVDYLYIETWVKTMDEIPMHLEMLKTKIAVCNQSFHDQEVAREQALLSINTKQAGEQGVQGLLNDVIAKLNFK